MHEVRASREAHGGDLALDSLGLGRLDMCLDGPWPAGKVAAELPQGDDVVRVHGQLVHGDVVRRVLGVRPAQDGAGGGIQDVLGVGAGEVGGEGHVEGVVYGGVGGRGRHYGGDAVGSLVVLLLLRRHRGHSHGIVGRSWLHAKARRHPVRPVPHVGELVHVDGVGGVAVQKVSCLPVSVDVDVGGRWSAVGTDDT